MSSTPVQEWSINDVKDYLASDDAALSARLDRWKMNGARLLKMTEVDILYITSGLSAGTASYLKDCITSLQQEHDDDDSENEKDDGGYLQALYSIKGGATRWSEGEVRRAFAMYTLEHKEFTEIGIALDRSRLACLTKVNLIRRAIQEDPEVAALPDVRNPKKFGGCYLSIIDDQNMKEQEHNQHYRIMQQMKRKQQESSDSDCSDLNGQNEGDRHYKHSGLRLKRTADDMEEDELDIAAKRGFKRSRSFFENDGDESSEPDQFWEMMKYHRDIKKRKISKEYYSDIDDTDEDEEEDVEYKVERIMGWKLEDGEDKYLVKWEGYGEDENSWEPLQNVAGNVKFTEFIKGKQQKLAEQDESGLIETIKNTDAATLKQRMIDKWEQCNESEMRAMEKVFKMVV